jgi:hypothetical protein
MLLNGIYDKKPEKLSIESKVVEMKEAFTEVMEDLDQFSLFDSMMTDAELFLKKTLPFKLEENPIL